MVARLNIEAVRRIVQTLVVPIGLSICPAGALPDFSGQEAVPRRIWHVPEPGRGGPAADDTTAYFLSTAHEVLAVDIATGVVRWRRKTLEEGDALSGAALLVDGESVIVGDYNLLAFNRRTGGLRWRFVPADGYGPGIYLGAVSAGLALAGSPSGHLYAVDVDSGALRWSTAVASDGKTTVFSPAAGESVVAAGFTEFTAPNGGGVVVVSRDTGRVLWKQRFPAPADTSLGTNWAGGPIIVGDELIASSGDGHIHAFDVASGALRWTIPRVSGPSPFPVAADHDFRPLALAGHLLVCGSLTGQIVAYDRVTREERWRFTATGLGSSAFRIAAIDGVVYVPFANGRLVALRAGDGQELWRIGDWTSGFLWPPAAHGDTVLLSGARDGMSAVSYEP
jgi:outer membrane protein assembly factor BamB